jgi:hypothetical protein
MKSDRKVMCSLGLDAKTRVLMDPPPRTNYCGRLKFSEERVSRR